MYDRPNLYTVILRECKEERRPCTSASSATTEHLKRYQDMGVARLVLVSPRRLADALPFLDRMAALIPTVQ